MAHQTGETAPPYTEAQATRWLAWLARGMQKHGQTVFLIEHLQPGWLTTRGQHLLDLLVFSAVFGLFIGWINVTMWEMVLLLSPWPEAPPLGFLWIWWVGSALWTLCVRALERIPLPRLTPSVRDRKRTVYRKVGARLAVYWVIWGGVWVLTGVLGLGLVALLEPAVYHKVNARLAVYWMIRDGSLFGLGLSALLVPLLQGALVVIFYTARVSLNKKNLTVEALGWSWRAAAKGLLGGLVTGHIHWSLFFLGTLMVETPASKLLENYMMFIPIHAACGFFFLGLSIRWIKMKTVPNQGVILSMRNALKGALIGVVIGPFCWLVFSVALKDAALDVPLSTAAPLGGLRFGMMVSVIGLLWFGGLNVLNHGTLRLALSATRQIPLRLARFLDYAAAQPPKSRRRASRASSTTPLHFLQRVGGGYMFIHRYLLEHFAAIETPKAMPRPASGLPPGAGNL